MTELANLFGSSQVKNKAGDQIDLAKHFESKTVGLYFSALWCPPCREFTPILIEFYKKHSNAKNFDIIFVSSDEDQCSFNEYFQEMPWLGLSYAERDKSNELFQKFGVQTIPKLVIINANDGSVLTDKGRNIIQSGNYNDASFPWRI